MKRSTSSVLDLHGARHHMVRGQVIKFIESLWGSSVKVEIITGHSESMKLVVKEVLDEYGLDCQEGDLSGLNMGMIRTEI